MKLTIQHSGKMIGKIIAGIFLFQTLSVRADAQTSEKTNVNVGIFYPISSNGGGAADYSNHFSLNAMLGISGSEKGFTLAGLTNLIFNNASGLQIAGFSNHIRNRAEGVQIAGFMNITGSTSGINLAGFGNFSRRNSTGTQIAGFINTSRNAGQQVAGFINKADTVSTQVAGFINIAKKVKGVQLAGFINIADSSEYPIGIFNFIKNGEKSMGVSTDETLTTLLSFRSGSHKLYGIAALGYNNKGSRRLAAWEAGLGAHLLTGENFRLNVEGVTSGLTDFKNGDYFRSSIRILPALRIGPRLELFAGPSFNYVYSHKGQASDLVSHYVWSETKNNKDLYGVYFGITGGLSIRL